MTLVGSRQQSPANQGGVLENQKVHNDGHSRVHGVERTHRKRAPNQEPDLVALLCKSPRVPLVGRDANVHPPIGARPASQPVDDVPGAWGYLKKTGDNSSGYRY